MEKNIHKKIVLECGSGEVVEKKSRFISVVKRVKTEEEAIDFVNSIKKKYYDAKHNCMAYVIDEKNEITRFSDDGEPSGSAGKPMLDILVGNNITNVVVVVTRYFGGTLLGTGGLVRAYQKAVQLAVENSTLAQIEYGYLGNVVVDYNDIGKIQYIALRDNINIIDTQYTQEVTVSFVCENEKYKQFLDNITEVTKGMAKMEKKKKVTYYKTQKGIEIV